MSDFLSGDDNAAQGQACEVLQLAISECFIYKVPPLRSASGHRAEEWDLANPLVTGCLRMYQSGEVLRIALYSLMDATSANRTDGNIKLFGECVIPGLTGAGAGTGTGGGSTSSSSSAATDSPSSSGSGATSSTTSTSMSEKMPIYVDSVVDSSRYYVLRLLNRANGRTAMVGLGFRERETAFDFKSVLAEYVRRVDNMHNIVPASHDAGVHLLAAPDSAVDDDEEEGAGAEGRTDVTRSLADLSLKEGETIKLKLKVPSKGKTSGSGSSASGGSGSTGGAFTLAPPRSAKSTLLAPPPAAAPAPGAPPAPNASVAAAAAAAAAAAGSSTNDDDDDFADFVSA